MESHQLGAWRRMVGYINFSILDEFLTTADFKIKERWIKNYSKNIRPSPRHNS
jgi:hypothetical protein